MPALPVSTRLLSGEKAEDRKEITEPLQQFKSLKFELLETTSPLDAVQGVRGMLELARNVVVQNRLAVLQPLLLQIPTDENGIVEHPEDEDTGPRFSGALTLSHIVYR